MIRYNFAEHYQYKTSKNNREVFMKFRVLVFALALCVLFSGAAEAKSSLVSGSLPNGVKVYVLEDHNNPLVALQIWVKTGGVNESYKTRGMSHFLEHLLFKGTKKRKVGEIDRELDAIGAYNNAATYYDYTYFQATGASCYFDKMLDIEVDGVLNSALDTEEVEKERKVVIEEIKMGQDQPFRVLYKAIHKNLFDNLPYAYPVIGFQNIIETVPREVIYDYYKEKYNPKNMIVVVVGDIKPEAALTKVSDAFKNITSDFGPNEKIDGSFEEKIEKPRFQEIKMDVEKTYLSITYRGVPRESDDVAALDVLSTILGGGESSRLNQLLKEKNKVVESVMNTSWNFRSSGAFVTMMVLDSHNAEKAKELFFKDIEAIKGGSIKPEELDKAKNQIETSYILAHQNYEGMAEYIGETITLSSDAKLNSYLDDIKKVTKEDLKKAAEKYLYPEGYSMVVINPVKKIEKKGSVKGEK